MDYKPDLQQETSLQPSSFVTFPPSRQSRSDPFFMALFAVVSLFVLLFAAVDPYPEETGPWLLALALLCLCGTVAWFLMRVVVARRRGSS